MVTRLAFGVVGLALLATACTSGDPDEAPLTEGAEDEIAYLEEVRAAQAVRDQEIDALIETLSTTYQTQDRLFDVAAEIELRAATDEALAAASDLSPPPRFRDDHDSWVESMEASGRHLEEAQEALERGDLVDMTVSFMRVEVELSERLPDWSEEFCRAAVPMVDDGFEGGPDAVCLRGDSIPGGEYGRALYDTVLRTQLTVGRRIGFVGLPAFSEDQERRYLTIVQPEVEELFEQALETIRTLAPPEELQDDHALIVGFYEDILATAQEITAAAEQGDSDRLPSLYQESQEPGTMLKQELSAEAQPIVEMFHFFAP